MNPEEKMKRLCSSPSKHRETWRSHPIDVRSRQRFSEAEGAAAREQVRGCAMSLRGGGQAVWSEASCCSKRLRQ
jgi:hypothetical protein